MNQIINCPHCHDCIIIESINCGIFRHGIYKNNINEQLNPHSSKELCDRLALEDKIYGCGKPFKVSKTDTINELLVEICDYI